MAQVIHNEPHPLAGKVVLLSGGEFDGREYRIEDWWDRLGQGPWGTCNGNPACLDYALRSGMEIGAAICDKSMTREEASKLSGSNEVVYGHLTSGLGKLIHVRQLGALKE